MTTAEVIYEPAGFNEGCDPVLPVHSTKIRMDAKYAKPATI